MKLEATPEGAAALREFAETMPLAIENIRVSTEDLFGIYQSVAENVGPHEQDFRQMLATVKKAQEEASDSIQKLPQMLKKTAEKIDKFVAKKRGIAGN